MYSRFHLSPCILGGWQHHRKGKISILILQYKILHV